MRNFNKIFLLKGVLFSSVNLLILAPLFAAQRFPKPDFDVEHVIPKSTTPMPDVSLWEGIHLAVFIIVLLLATFFVLKKRSRKAIFILTLFNLGYFGFFRSGCICSIGAIQNFVYSLCNDSYIIPITVILFFLIPLVLALLVGRVFCSSVCPLGAIQDLVLIKPIKVPYVLSQILSFFPYFYLGLAVLLAGTGAGFIICRYDPFIGLFRLDASFQMFLLCGTFLLISMFIGRSYCRFVCPYGVLLKWMSLLSKYHMTITPNTCVNCRLCENACPFDAINIPVPSKYPETRKQGRGKLGKVMMAIPFILILFSVTGYMVSSSLSKFHSTVALAERIHFEETSGTFKRTIESKSFRGSGESNEELFEKAFNIQDKFKVGSLLFGLFMGIVFSLRLISLFRKRELIYYEADHGNCYSCGRCFLSCPVEHNRLKKIEDSD